MIETDESVREALIILDLEKGATITEIRAQYLGKTSRDKFQHGVLVNEHQQKEFDKYHSAYVTLAQHLSEGDQASDLQFYPPDQVFQFHFNQGVHYFIHQNYIKAGELRKALTMFETAKTLNPGRHEVAFRIKEIMDRLKIKSISEKKPSTIKRFFKKLSGQ